MSAAPVLKYTIEQYLEMEDASPEKNEFYNGEIFAMAGASLNHNKIVSCTHIFIGSHLTKSKKCDIFPSDLKIHCKTNSLFTYPDLSIICGEPEVLEGRKDIVTNPSVLIEVLSPSTQDYDRGSKFGLYRKIESLKEYITISSMEVYVEKHDKQSDGSWLLNEYKNMEESFNINSIGLEFLVGNLYNNLTFE